MKQSYSLLMTKSIKIYRLNTFLKECFDKEPSLPFSFTIYLSKYRLRNDLLNMQFRIFTYYPIIFLRTTNNLVNIVKFKFRYPVNGAMSSVGITGQI